ncbi:RDD family protein [Halosegnis sp.]|uniref:RDD family protein n=1 Tax=Halosegnis sp. TaxID=2864959 RepID=UPI0035D426D3
MTARFGRGMEKGAWASRLLSLYPTSQPPQPALETAGDLRVLGDRLLAAGFDLFVCLFVLEAPALYVLDALSGGIVGESPLFVPATLAALAPLVVTYSFVFEWRYARTPGKVWRGLVTATDAGEPCTGLASAVRNLCRYFDYLGIPPLVVGVIAALVSGRGKRLGDQLAGTVVVRAG